MYNYYGDNVKKIFIITLFIVSFLFTNVLALNEFVIDDAKLLKNDTVEYINTYSNFLKNKADIDYYVYTVKDLGEYDSDTFSNMVYSEYIKNKNDYGILIFICRNTREVKVIIGKGLSNVVSEEMINEYINDYFISFLSNNEWDSGIKNGYTAFFKYVCLHLDVDTSGLEVTDGNDFIFKYRYYILFISIWICNLIGYILPHYFLRLFNKNYKVTNLDNIIFYGCVFFNVFVLYYNFIIEYKFLLILLLFEVFSILSGTILKKNGSKKRKKKK